MEEYYDYRVVEEKLSRADEVFRRVPGDTLYFYDPDDEKFDIVFRGGEDGCSWDITDGLLFSIKLDDYTLYEDIKPSEALELLAERRKERNGQK